MKTSNSRDLAPGYTSEVVNSEEANTHDLNWDEIVGQFDDANIYQCWPYGKVTAGPKRTLGLILRRHGEIVAVVLARVAKLPIVNIGIAYVRWGPLWMRSGVAPDTANFQQVLRALRNEFVCKRKLVLRIIPALFDDGPTIFPSLLAEEGFFTASEGLRSRTILMDMSPSIEELYEGMQPHWKRELKVAQRSGMEIVEGTDDELFEQFIHIYKEMVARKQFVEPNDINQFRSIQSQLPSALKMKIMLCKADGNVHAGLICSVMGKSAVYLFGATSDVGLKSRGSYRLQWELIHKLKSSGISVYNLNGINPGKNPGTYKFKNDLAGKYGKDLYFLGRADSCPRGLSYTCVRGAEELRTVYRKIKRATKLPWDKRLSIKPVR